MPGTGPFAPITKARAFVRDPHLYEEIHCKADTADSFAHGPLDNPSSPTAWGCVRIDIGQPPMNSR